MTPKIAMTWIDVMKAGGPYAVILALAFLLFLAVREIKNKDAKLEVLNKLIYTINKKRTEDNKKVADSLLKEGKESTKAYTELTGALDNLTDKIGGLADGA